MDRPTLHLASASPRRRQLLTALGLRFTAGGADIDESRRENEPPQAMVERLAVEKAAASGSAADLVLGADTAVVLDGRVFGKPAGQDECLSMLAELSGRTHEVMTGIALQGRAATESAVSVTRVRFRDIGRDEALTYWQSGEPADKAGAYAIQGLGGLFVAAIEGSYSGVVGLPVFETAQLLSRAGLKILDRHTLPLDRHSFATGCK